MTSSLEEQILAARAAQERAQAAFDRCPSGDNEAALNASNASMDDALDRWARARAVARVAAA